MEVVRAAVTQCRTALQFAGKTAKENVEVEGAAVTQCRTALQFAGETAKENVEVEGAAVTHCGTALQFAGETAKDNPEVVRAAVTNCGTALQYAGETARNDLKIVVAAVTEDGRALQFASEEFRDNPAVVAHAVSQPAGHVAVRFASDRLLLDKNFAPHAKQEVVLFQVLTMAGRSCIFVIDTSQYWESRVRDTVVRAALRQMDVELDTRVELLHGAALVRRNAARSTNSTCFFRWLVLNFSGKSQWAMVNMMFFCCFLLDSHLAPQEPSNTKGF